MKVGSLCSGAGGLDLAAGDVLNVRPVWVAETDPDASVVLRNRFDVPNLGDISAVDWRRVEPVDVITAGFPCQDISNAGKRAGIDGDQSGVWRHVAAAVSVVRPRLVLVENVAALLIRGGVRVIADLAALGYVGSWLSLRASDVGAPHQRNRIFLAAAPADPDGERVRVEPVAQRARDGAPFATADRPEPGVSYKSGRRMLDDAVALLPTPGAWEATRSGPHARYGNGQPQLSSVVALLPTPKGTEGSKGGPNQRGSAGDLTLTSSVMLLPTPTAVDARGTRNATSGRSTAPSASMNHDGRTLHDIAHADRWAQYSSAIIRWETVLGRPAPNPTVTGKRGGLRLSGRFVEWMFGWPDGWVTDLVDNTAALRLCGNGVVRQQGSAAFRQLLGADPELYGLIHAGGGP